MATVPYTKPSVSRGVHTYQWAGLANGDDGTPISVPRHSGKSVQVTGTQGAGGNVRIEGRNSPTGTYTPLNDPQGTPLNIGAPGADGSFEQILEDSLEIRPRVTAGDGSTAYTVRLIATTTGR